MKKFRFFAALCCAAAVFAACEKNDEPKNDSNNNQNEETTTGTENGHDWVNLGLPSGTKWATCNVGATSPEKYGNYYAWGETTTKSDYSWDTYKYGTYNYDGDYSKLTKYNTSDGKTTLEASDDAATTNWGSAWRMPTDGEWTELRENCEWIWTDSYQTTGVAGYWVTGKNGNTIFLPAAGCRYYDYLGSAGSGGYYWSSSLSTSYPFSAWYADFDSDNVGRGNGYYRYYGHSVRPVHR